MRQRSSSYLMLISAPSPSTRLQSKPQPGHRLLTRVTKHRGLSRLLAAGRGEERDMLQELL